MIVNLFHGYPDRIGKRAAFVGSGTGPTSYTGGNSPTDTVTTNAFQFYIDSISEVSISISGTYYGIGQPSVAGTRATWKMRYFTTATGAEVSNGTNLSAESFIVAGFGGFN